MFLECLLIYQIKKWNFNSLQSFSLQPIELFPLFCFKSSLVQNKNDATQNFEFSKNEDEHQFKHRGSSQLLVFFYE